jgi:hypothetical protein
MIRIHLLAFGMALALFAPTVQGAVDIPTITRTIEVPHEDGTVVLASSADPETPIVTWERWPGELRIEEPAEKFELYADGRLLVIYPEYRIFAGTYELQLSEEDTRDVLHELATCGILESDGRAWKNEVRERDLAVQEEARRRGEATITRHRTSETVTVLRSDLVPVKSSDPITSATKPTPHVFRYAGLDTDAAKHPGLEHLATAAKLERRLLQWAEEARVAAAED